MKLNLKALVWTSGILWALVLLLTGIANLIWSGYGAAFLQIWASVYPGYKASGTILDVISGTLYACVDGAVAGLVFGWLYNVFASKSSAA
jgi:ABC-type phosphate transport system permease subunit